MNTAFEKLCQHLTDHDIGFWSSSEELSVCTDLRGQVATYRIYAQVGADDGLLQIFGQSPMLVPEGARPAIAETVARINWGLKVGKFEFNLDAGDLRFQAAQALSDGDIDDEVIGRLFGTTMWMLDTYLPAVMSVIYANELPQDAVRHVEPRQETPDESARGDID